MKRSTTTTTGAIGTVLLVACAIGPWVAACGSDGSTVADAVDGGGTPTGTPTATPIPTPPDCGDGAKNGSESDVDCGGSCKATCGVGKACGGAADCATGVCTANVCAAPACTDTVKNGAETDVDCGGACPNKCADGKACSLPADCTTGACSGNKCVAPTCADGEKNGTETDTDCGGTCAKCADTKVCVAWSDCASGICTGNKCQSNECAPNPCLNGATCIDGDKSFTCTCAAGYSGATCATNVNECAGNPCQNGGTCADGINKYTCTCAVGYSGVNCETNIDDCAANPCSNGGTCADGVNSYTCTCPVDWTGAKCDARHTTCLSIKAQTPAAPDGNYTIDPDGAGPMAALLALCDMTTDGGGYTMVGVTGGISTTRFDTPNSCTALGMQMVVPRTSAHLTALRARFAASYFTVVSGVYGLAAGDYTGCAMNSSSAACAANWKAIDGGSWFAKPAAYSEPNGDYTPGCWLGTDGQDIASGQYVRFNDAACGYATGGNYICSDNAKP